MNPHPIHPVPVGRRGFSLVELLVVVSIMLVLMAMVGGGVAAARGSQKRQATQALIAKLDAIIQQHYATYASRSVAVPSPLPSGFTSRTGYRGWHIRRNLVSGDLPDRWTDVEVLASGTTVAQVLASGTSYLPMTGAQHAYAALWTGSGAGKPTPQYAGAECLFMIMMNGGIADCLDCSELKSSAKGDKDGDGFFEFWDAWDNPIAFILWPGGLKLPASSSDSFFAPAAPFTTWLNENEARPLMRPLIYSAGPDGEYGFERDNETGNIGSAARCGDPSFPPTSIFASPGGGAADNITNFDAQVVK
jgi:prepilin-type N-terminal cleavage/methylation domain-containing protein